MQSIFISYRQRDTGGHVGRLAVELRQQLGATAVFFDEDTIQDGEDFLIAIRTAIRKSDVVLVVIGSDWVDVKDDHGRRRLDDPQDTVRIEIQTALDANRPIIPILVEDAKMPHADLLPQAIQTVQRLKARKLRNGDWKYDIERLVAALRGLAAGQNAQPNAIAGPLMLAVIIFSIGALGIALLASAQQLMAFRLISDPAAPKLPGWNPSAQPAMFTALSMACSLAVAVCRRGAPADYRALIAAGCAANFAVALGNVYLGFTGFSLPVTPGQMGLGVLFQVAPIIAFGSWATAYARRGISLSFWVAPYAIAGAVIVVKARSQSSMPLLSLSINVILVAAAAWMAFEAWRRTPTRGLALAAIGTAAWLIADFYRTFGIPANFTGGVLDYRWMAHGAAWSLLQNAGTWLVAMSAGENAEAFTNDDRKRMMRVAT